MSYGMQVLDTNQVVVYDSSSVTWNQVDFMQVPGGGSVSVYFPALLGREVLCVQMLVDAPPLNRRAVAHTIEVIGATVKVSGGSENALILVLMR